LLKLAKLFKVTTGFLLAVAGGVVLQEVEVRNGLRGDAEETAGERVRVAERENDDCAAHRKDYREEVFSPEENAQERLVRDKAAAPAVRD
jgi:hypothetical protein